MKCFKHYTEFATGGCPECKREAELITCGVPGKAFDALCVAAAQAGMDVVDRLAFNAYEMADAMLKQRQS